MKHIIAYSASWNLYKCFTCGKVESDTTGMLKKLGNSKALTIKEEECPELSSLTKDQCDALTRWAEFSDEFRKAVDLFHKNDCGMGFIKFIDRLGIAPWRSKHESNSSS